MALTGSASKRYSEALLELADEAGAREAWTAALDTLARTLDADALRLLGNPSIPLDARRAALERATSGQPDVLRALLQTLLERERIGLLPAIAQAYHDLLDARAGVVKAVITTAVPLEEAERRELLSRLERASGKRLRPTFAIDPAIQGGLIARIGDHQVDGSLRTRLAMLRGRLAQGT
jgi:F-type H+-transporting ATPase subunit delta